MHLTTPAPQPTSLELTPLLDLRGLSTADAIDALLAAHFPPTRYKATRPITLRRFHVSATRADGSTHSYVRTGGNSADHALEAQEIAGLGGVVRVLPLDAQEAA